MFFFVFFFSGNIGGLSTSITLVKDKGITKAEEVGWHSYWPSKEQSCNTAEPFPWDILTLAQLQGMSSDKENLHTTEYSMVKMAICQPRHSDPLIFANHICLLTKRDALNRGCSVLV
jgi:hypothetical protein